MACVLGFVKFISRNRLVFKLVGGEKLFVNFFRETMLESWVGFLLCGRG